MHLGFIGLGKMGLNMTRRLTRGGHTIHAYDLSPSARAEAQADGAKIYSSLDALVRTLKAEAPARQIHALWVMVPAGDITKKTILEAASLLERGDVIIDGGNSNYKQTKALGDELERSGILLLDAGTSGGIWGLSEGYCLMIGGDADACKDLAPIFETLAPKDGWLRVGPRSAGHFTKMVHNGIEYAMMQAYAEGFELLQAQPDFDLDTAAIAGLWRHGSVVRSWLLDLLEGALKKNPALSDLQPYVEDSGEGRWTVEAGIEHAVPTPTIAAALYERFRSRQDNSYALRILSALRREFGGHSAKTR